MCRQNEEKVIPHMCFWYKQVEKKGTIETRKGIILMLPQLSVDWKGNGGNENETSLHM